MKLQGPYQPTRQLAVGKTVYVRVDRGGQLVVCKWPKKRPRVTHPTTLEQMERFRQANWLAKYAAPAIQIAHREMVKGTQLLPRDLMVASMLGRGLNIQIPGQRRRYPIAAIKDLSETLDILGSLTSGVLVRGLERWEAAETPTPGYVLTSQGLSLPPAWLPPGELGQGWRNIADETLSAGIGLNAFHAIAIPGVPQEVEFLVTMPPVVATGMRGGMRVNGISAANYSDGQIGRWAVSSTINDRVTAQTSWRLSNAAWTTFAAYYWIRGRVSQASDSTPIQAQITISGAGFYRLDSSCELTLAANDTIHELSFAGTALAGLPAGTRFIVRAAYV